METCAAQVAWARVLMNDNEFIQDHRVAGIMPTTARVRSREIPKEWEARLRLSAAKPASARGTMGRNCRNFEGSRMLRDQVICIQGGLTHV